MKIDAKFLFFNVRFFTPPKMYTPFSGGIEIVTLGVTNHESSSRVTQSDLKTTHCGTQ